MAIELTREQEDLVQREMAARGYDTPSQVIDEALRMYRNGLRPGMDLSEVREKIRRGLEQADRGEFVNKSVMEIAAEARRRRDARA